MHKRTDRNSAHRLNVGSMRVLRPLLLILATMAAVSPGLAQMPDRSAREGRSPEDTKSLGERLFDVESANNPKIYPGDRVNHAKGGLFEGVFNWRR